MPAFSFREATNFTMSSPDIIFSRVETTGQPIMPVCCYAIYPVPNCMGLVISAYEPDSGKMFLELSRKWYLECPVC
jgi:hypothetical protein